MKRAYGLLICLILAAVLPAAVCGDGLYAGDPPGISLPEVYADEPADETLPVPGDVFVCVCMDGEAASDGRFYYRADNCGIRVIIETDGGADPFCEAEIDGRADTARLAYAYTDGGFLISWSAEEVSALLEDGPHTVNVYAAGAAGNRQMLEIGGVYGVSCCGTGAEFILDTTAPECCFSLSSESEPKRSARDTGGRYFYAGDFTAKVTIIDAYADEADFVVLRGSAGDGIYDSLAAEVTEYDTVIYGRYTDEGLVFADQVQDDGVYRYTAAGSDKAGNRIIFGNGFLGDEASVPSVRDTVPPRGFVSVLGDGGIVYRADSEGNVLFADIYRKEEDAAVEFRTDTYSEHSPVLLRGEVLTSDGERLLADTGGFVYGASAECLLKGGRSMRSGSFYMEDLAGNVTEGLPSDEIFFDAEAPVISTFSFVNEPSAGGSLFAGDVCLKLTVKDPEENGGSGIGDVIVRIYEDGGSVPVEEYPVHQRAQSAFEGAPDGKDRIYTFEKKITVGSGHYSDHITAVVTAEDNAGNAAEKSLSFGIDARAPEITADFGGNSAKNGFYFNSGREVRITVRERHFDPALIDIRCNGESVDCEWESGGEDVWTAAVLFQEEGKYDFFAKGRDTAGNEAGAGYLGDAPEHFVIDRTKPVIVMRAEPEGAGDISEKYVREMTGLTLKVEDENFAGEHALNITDPKKRAYTFDGGELSVRLDADGTWAIEGTVTDLAGNVSEPLSGRTWIVDRTPPEIAIAGVEEASANTEVPSAELMIREAHPDEKTLSLVLEGAKSGKREIPYEKRESAEGMILIPELPEEDDWYTLSCSISDRAGNRAEAAGSFSVNREGPHLGLISPDREDMVLDGPVKVRILVEDVDPVTVKSALINGSPAACSLKGEVLEFEDELTEDGKYVVSLEVRDAAGHEASLPGLEFMIDTTPPLLMLEVTGGERKAYDEDVEVLLTADDPDAELTELTVDGKSLLAGVPFEEGRGSILISADDPGRHRISVTVQDEAGNESEPGTLTVTIAGDGSHAVPVLVLAALAVLLVLVRRAAKK